MNGVLKMVVKNLKLKQVQKEQKMKPKKIRLKLVMMPLCSRNYLMQLNNYIQKQRQKKLGKIPTWISSYRVFIQKEGLIYFLILQRMTLRLAFIAEMRSLY